MKRLIVLGCLLALAAPAAAEKPEIDEQAAMEAWSKAATPGDFHAFFAKKAGKWQLDGKMWMSPDAEPVTSTYECSAEMIMGGRYLKEEMSGMSMGMPYEGMGITGYDNVTGLVTTTWFDNMGTVTSIFQGEYETPGEPLHLKGELTDPFTKEKMQVRVVTTFISDNESMFEYYGSMMAGMPEMKLMELHYKRVAE